jgi:predicted transcriptional regulator
MVRKLNNESVHEGILCELTNVFDCVHRDTSLSKLDFCLKKNLAMLINESNRTTGIDSKVWR